MTKSVRRVAIVFIGAAAFISSAAALAADSAAKPPVAAKPPAAATKPPAAAQYYSLVGYWKGLAELSVPGQEPAKLSVSFGCSKVAGGWAVRREIVLLRLAPPRDAKASEADA